MTEVLRIVSSFQQTGGLGAFAGVEQANLETIQTVGRRCCPDFPGRNRISGQEKVLSVTPNFQRPLDCALHHAMPPGNAPLRSAAQHAQLNRFENAGEFRLDKLADGGLAHSARACDEEKHASNRHFSWPRRACPHHRPANVEVATVPASNVPERASHRCERQRNGQPKSRNAQTAMPTIEA